MNTLDKLEALLKKARPRPWDYFDSTDIPLMIALVNAAPALIAAARTFTQRIFDDSECPACFALVFEDEDGRYVDCPHEKDCPLAALTKELP